MDKTGTITEGKPKLVAFELLDSDAELATMQCLEKSLAARSDHLVSKAIAEGNGYELQILTDAHGQILGIDVSVNVPSCLVGQNIEHPHRTHPAPQ